jgi:hypothetical protein
MIMWGDLHWWDRSHKWGPQKPMMLSCRMLKCARIFSQLGHHNEILKLFHDTSRVTEVYLQHNRATSEAQLGRTSCTFIRDTKDHNRTQSKSLLPGPEISAQTPYFHSVLPPFRTNFDLEVGIFPAFYPSHFSPTLDYKGVPPHLWLVVPQEISSDPQQHHFLTVPCAPVLLAGACTTSFTPPMGLRVHLHKQPNWALTLHT